MNHSRELVLITLFSKFSQGAYLVCVAWILTAHEGNSSIIGIWFLSNSLVGLGIGPLLGAFVDRYSIRTSYALGELLIAFGVLEIILIFMFDERFATLIVVGSSLLVSVGVSASIPASFAAIKLISSTGSTGSLVGNISVSIQLGLATGAGFGGVIVSYTSPSVSIALCSLFFFVSSLLVLSRKFLASASNDEDYRISSSNHNVMSGLKYLNENRRIFYLLFSIAILNGVGQVINLLLPSLIGIVLELSSTVYGVADAIWSGGAVLGGWIGGYYLSESFAKFAQSISSVIASVILILGSFLLNGAFSVIIFCFVLGFIFSIGKVLLDIEIITSVDQTYVGRVRSIGQLFIGLFGVVIYSAPSLFRDLPPPTTLLFSYATLLLCLAVLVYFVLRKHRTITQQ